MAPYVPYLTLMAGGALFGIGVLSSYGYDEFGRSRGTSSLCFVGIVLCVGAIIWSLI